MKDIHSQNSNPPAGSGKGLGLGLGGGGSQQSTPPGHLLPLLKAESDGKPGEAS